MAVWRDTAGHTVTSHVARSVVTTRALSTRVRVWAHACRGITVTIAMNRVASVWTDVADERTEPAAAYV